MESQADFFANLPRGKEDAPLLFPMGELIYDFHDVDGQLAMLDERLSGCLVMMWAKPMNAKVDGIATIDGKTLKKCVLLNPAVMHGMWILGIPLRGHIYEYGKEYNLHIEGFEDMDGNKMNPQDFVIRSIEKTEPSAENKKTEDVAYQAACEGIVLLENNNVLPLQKGIKLNIIGKGVYDYRHGAVGAGRIIPRYSISLLEALRDSHDVSLNEELLKFYEADEDLLPTKELLKEAVSFSDTALMVISRMSGENLDNSTKKGEYYLTDEEDSLIKCASENFKNVIVILNVGYPIDVSFVKNYGIKGVIYSGYGGMRGGEAIVDVLLGNVNPSGKLPDTWTNDYYDIPSSMNFYNCADKKRLDAECEEYVDTVYEEDIWVGYRYFTSFEKKVAYPFGFGLSYTDFMIEAESLHLSNKEIQFTVHIKNMGKVPGKEVVQIYVGKPELEEEQPVKELVWFEKTKELKPGEEQVFSINIPNKRLSTWSEKRSAYYVPKGTFKVYAGNDVVSSDFIGQIEIKEAVIIKKASHLLKPGRTVQKLRKDEPELTYPKGEESGIISYKKSFMPYEKRKKYEADFKGVCPRERATFDKVVNGIASAEDFVAQMTVPELARISVCASSGWGMEGIGEAGRIFKVEGYGLPDYPVSDGNSGVNLKQSNIGMPSGVTICASFNKKLAMDVGVAIGTEAKRLGMPMILAPALNIHRNPLNGRHPEYFSEDPYLAGMMAGYYAKGLEETGVASCMKHVLGNNAESSRKRNMSIIPERALRDIYMKAFEIAMEVQIPTAIMTAYNGVNGVPTACDEELIQGLFREENGFDGFVMTDWTSYDTVDVAAMVEAGNCWITPGSTDDTYTKQIVDGVTEGRIRKERLQENVTYIIKALTKKIIKSHL